MTRKFSRGDVVRVARKIDGPTPEWDNVWVKAMDAAVGRAFPVEGHYDEFGVELFLPVDIADHELDALDRACDYRFPPEALELVSQAVMEET